MMGRYEMPNHLFHNHLGPAGDLSASHYEGPELEAWPGNLAPGDPGDHFSSSWEAAWIDLGGEG
jgi:hypothetical protein